jgi:hypothetical protein
MGFKGSLTRQVHEVELGCEDALVDAGLGLLLDVDGEDGVGAVGLAVQLVLGGGAPQLPAVSGGSEQARS